MEPKKNWGLGSIFIATREEYATVLSYLSLLSYPTSKCSHKHSNSKSQVSEISNVQNSTLFNHLCHNSIFHIGFEFPFIGSKYNAKKGNKLTDSTPMGTINFILIILLSIADYIQKTERNIKAMIKMCIRIT